MACLVCDPLSKLSISTDTNPVPWIGASLLCVYIISLCLYLFVIHHIHFLVFCASSHSSLPLPCPFSIYPYFSVHSSSVSLLDRGAPASETRVWDLPLPQLSHPLHRHSVPSCFWLSGLWPRLCSESQHPAPSLFHPFRLCLAEKECVLHREPATGSFRYSRNSVCHQVTEQNSVVLVSPVYSVNSRAVIIQLDLTGVTGIINSTCIV